MLAVMESLNGTEKRSGFFSFPISSFPLYSFYIKVLFHPPVQQQQIRKSRKKHQDRNFIPQNLIMGRNEVNPSWFHCKTNWNEWSECGIKRSTFLFLFWNTPLSLSLSLLSFFWCWAYAVEAGVHHYLIIQVGKVEGGEKHTKAKIIQNHTIFFIICNKFNHKT